MVFVPNFMVFPSYLNLTRPLRPIVSFINSPTYQLSKELIRILNPVVGKTHFKTKNSVKFAEKIQNYQLYPDKIMVSFDIVSLFTKTPIQLTIETARSKLENDETLYDHTKIKVDDICEGLKICLGAMCLSFQDKYYKQIYGTTMGSPVSVVLANLVMENVEERAVSFSPLPKFG